MFVSQSLIVFTGFAAGEYGDMIPWKYLNFQNFRNVILDTLAECLHYHRYCHHNIHIQKEINKSLKKPDIIFLFFKEVTCGGSRQILKSTRGVVPVGGYLVHSRGL